MSEAATVLEQAHSLLPARGNRFVELLEAGEIPGERLEWLAGELYHLVRSDRRSFALAGSRFPDSPFLALASGESEALALLLDFAAAVDAQPRRHEPRPLAQAYPAFLAQTAMYGSRSDLALALLANVGESGRTYARVADALQAHYGLDDRAVAHFRFFADTPPALLDEAMATLATGLAGGDDAATAIRTARMVDAYEHLFWDALAT